MFFIVIFNWSKR